MKSIRTVVALITGIFAGFFMSPSYATDTIFCNGFESCPAAPTHSGPFYGNGWLKDANGKLLGFLWYRNNFITTKGYWFNLYTDSGYYINLPIWYESDDCSGQGYAGGFDQGYTGINPVPGQVFLTHDSNEEYIVAYTEIHAVPSLMTANSIRRYNGSTHGVCESISPFEGKYAPVYPNNPDITGLPSDVGTRDNPFPLPLEIVN